MTHAKTVRARVAALLGAAALGMAALAAAAPAAAAPAAAAPTSGAPAATSSDAGPQAGPAATETWGPIPAGPYILDVYKYVGDGSGADAPGTRNDGTAQELPQGSRPLAGVTFTVTPVDISLWDPAGWQGIERLARTGTPAVSGGQVHLGGVSLPLKTSDTVSRTTAPDGLAAFTGLPRGAYLVEETNPGANRVAALADPFLVTLPFPTGDGGWLTCVSVYPKNTLLAPPAPPAPTAGGLAVQKYAAGTTMPVPGAIFRIYASRADAAAGRDPVPATDAGASRTAFTTDGSGRFLADGLPAGSYYLVETAAPVGFGITIDARHPQPFTVTAGQTTYLVIDDPALAGQTTVPGTPPAHTGGSRPAAPAPQGASVNTGGVRAFLGRPSASAFALAGAGVIALAAAAAAGAAAVGRRDRAA